MKKVKLMLLSLSIFAVVGGALAFTVKDLDRVCTAKVNSNGSCPQFCPTPKNLATLNPTGAFVCTAPTVIGGIDECHTVATQTAQCVAASIQSTVE